MNFKTSVHVPRLKDNGKSIYNYVSLHRCINHALHFLNPRLLNIAIEQPLIDKPDLVDVLKQNQLRHDCTNNHHEFSLMNAFKAIDLC